MLRTQQLLHTSPGSLLNVALTCKSFYELAKTFIYKTVHFTFNRDRRGMNGALIKRLLEDDDLSKKVRCVRIDWAPNAKLQAGEGSKQELDLLGRALPKLARLRTFIWDAQYPIVSWLLDMLRSCHPGCKMYIRHPPNQDAARTLSRLQNLPNLHALDASLLDGQIQAYKVLGKLLASSSIKEFTFTSPVEQIDLVRVLSKLPGPLHLRSLEINGLILDLSLYPIAWSQVTSLAIRTNASCFVGLPCFDNLRSLDLRLWSVSENSFLDQFLQSCQRLEDLSLNAFRNPARDWRTAQWRHLGKTLLKLRLHDEERHHLMYEGQDPMVDPSNSTLALIAMECPRLQSLGIELTFDGSWVSPEGDADSSRILMNFPVY